MDTIKDAAARHERSERAQKDDYRRYADPSEPPQRAGTEPPTVQTTTGVLVETERYNTLVQAEKDVFEWRMRTYEAIKAVYDLTGIDENEITDMLIEKDRPFHRGIPVPMPPEMDWVVDIAHARKMTLGDFIRKIVADKLAEIKSGAASPRRLNGYRSRRRNNA